MIHNGAVSHARSRGAAYLLPLSLSLYSTLLSPALGSDGRDRREIAR